VDILLVHLLRAWLGTGPAQTPPASWPGALTDPVAGPALAALHTQPGRDRTAASLAAATGVCRATLARRFLAKAGDTPAAYLTRWRMDLAAQRLRDTGDTAGAIARSLGYTSEYAFNRAFTRARRTPPGRYRSRSRAASQNLHPEPHRSGRPEDQLLGHEHNEPLTWQENPVHMVEDRQTGNGQTWPAAQNSDAERAHVTAPAHVSAPATSTLYRRPS